MKLYATTTSERASKGQGGNDHILSVFTVEIDGHWQEIASVSIVNRVESYYFSVVTPSGKQIREELLKSNNKTHTCTGCGAIQQSYEGYCDSCKGLTEEQRDLKGNKKKDECANIGSKIDGFGLCPKCNQFHHRIK